MTHSYGRNAKTRRKFARGYRQHGQIPLSTYMTTYKVGDYVTIKTNGSIQKGMPHRFYHGRTGRIYDVTPRAVGIIMHRIHKGVERRKRVIVRIEHIVPSNCQAEANRLKAINAKIEEDAKKAGSIIAEILTN